MKKSKSTAQERLEKAAQMSKTKHRLVHANKNHSGPHKQSGE
jgi:hypothetical protein